MAITWLKAAGFLGTMLARVASWMKKIPSAIPPSRRVIYT